MPRHEYYHGYYMMVVHQYFKTNNWRLKMILKTSLIISDQTRTCQVSAELELDNQVTPEGVSTRTRELLLGLQSGITDAMSGSPLKNVTPSADPPALAAAVPSENITPAPNQPALPPSRSNNNVIPANRETWQTASAAPKRKQRPNDQPTPGQRKFVNDLLQKNGLDLASWCQEKNVPENQITAGNCQQWIPELKERLKNKGIPF